MRAGIDSSIWCSGDLVRQSEAKSRFGPSRNWAGAPGAALAGISAVVLLISILVLQPLLGASGDFWLATLWATWLASLVWALTRASFSIIFTALMLSMFVFIIVPATGAQLYGGTLLASYDYQSGVVAALKIAVLAQVAMVAGAILARMLWPARRFDRIAADLSASRLDGAAIVTVIVAVFGVIGMSIFGGASLGDYFVYTTSGGYGTFWSELHANLGFLVALQCVAGIAIVLLPLRLGMVSARRRVLPVAVAVLASLVLLGAGQRGPFVAAVSAAGLVWLKTSRKSRRQRRAVMTGALLLLVVTGLIGIARGAASNRAFSFNSVISEPFGAGNNLFLPLAGLSTTVPVEIPYLHGDSYLQVFVLPIPRSLWPGEATG